VTKTIVKSFQFRSKSDASIVYSTLIFQDGTVSCNCAGWCKRVADDGSRSCRHTQSPEVLAVICPATGKVSPSGHAMVLIPKRAVMATAKHSASATVNTKIVRRFKFED
jgi:hypothetical protein